MNLINDPQPKRPTKVCHSVVLIIVCCDDDGINRSTTSITFFQPLLPFLIDFVNEPARSKKRPPNPLIMLIDANGGPACPRHNLAAHPHPIYYYRYRRTPAQTTGSVYVCPFGSVVQKLRPAALANPKKVVWWRQAKRTTTSHQQAFLLLVPLLAQKRNRNAPPLLRTPPSHCR